MSKPTPKRFAVIDFRWHDEAWYIALQSGNYAEAASLAAQRNALGAAAGAPPTACVMERLDARPEPIEGHCACAVAPMTWNAKGRTWLSPLRTYNLAPGTHCHKCGAYLAEGVAIRHPMTREALAEAARKAEEATGDE